VKILAKRESLAVLLALGIATPAGAVTTRTFNTATYRDFDAGEAERAIITSNGEVFPGRQTDRVDLGTESVWTAVRGADGTVYTGSVTDGQIHAIAGKTKRTLASLAAETPWIGALAIAGNTLYAGTLGTGTVHAIDVKSGKVTKLATLGEGAQHIWGLVVDPAGKTLWAATGPTGKLYAIDLPSGKSRVVWESGEKHLLSLLRTSDGALWLGTAEEAVLYRFDPKTGQARAIADFAGSEIRGITEVQGGVVVAANEFDAKSSGVPTPPVKTGPKGTPAKAPEAGTAPGADKAASGDGVRADARKGKGALFRVDVDGRTEQLHALADGYYQAIAATPDGRIYAAAGSQGRVYVVSPDRTSSIVFDVKERQVNALLHDGTNVVFVTGDAGALYRTAGAAKDASYTSKVFDAQWNARWGNVRWQGSGVVIETRSGNTAKPGKGWSAWQKVAATARTGDGGQIGRSASPGGRYFQYKVGFDSSSGAVLRGVDVYYLPQNQRPRVTELTTEGGAGGAKAWVTLAPGVTKVRSPILKLKWKAENPDDDELVYKLELKGDGDAQWGEIPTGSDPLTAASFDWNTETIADGYYRVRVTVSDKRANPADTALTDTFLSGPFLIDNQKPQVQGLAVKGDVAAGRGVDSFSRIDEIAWQVDGGDWQVAAPSDGLFDDKEESFTFKLPADLKPGAHTLTVRVADEGDNIGTQSVPFKTGK
jgi:sugar lactone lactonase YvrE